MQPLRHLIFFFMHCDHYYNTNISSRGQSGNCNGFGISFLQNDLHIFSPRLSTCLYNQF